MRAEKTIKTIILGLALCLSGARQSAYGQSRCDQNWGKLESEIKCINYASKILTTIASMEGHLTPGIAQALFQDFYSDQASIGYKNTYVDYLSKYFISNAVPKTASMGSFIGQFSLHRDGVDSIALANKIIEIENEFGRPVDRDLAVAVPSILLPFSAKKFEYLTAGDLFGILYYISTHVEKTDTYSSWYVRDVTDLLSTILDGSESHYSDLFIDEGVVYQAQRIRGLLGEK